MGLGEDENIFNWEVMIVGPPDTLFEGGLFKAKLEFPNDFPNNPPVMTFTSMMWHPNGKTADMVQAFTSLNNFNVETLCSLS